MKDVVDPEKLESSLVELMETVDQLCQEKELLGGKLKQGIFNLSRARYSMGASNLGLQQYEGRSMAAAARVLVRLPHIQDPQLCQPSGPGLQMFVLMDELEQGAPAGQVSPGVVNNSLRKRTVATDAGTGGTNVNTPDLVQTKTPTSPISWFNGGMVPPALKEAQQDFRAVVELAILVANSSHAVNSALSHWQMLSGSGFIDGDSSIACSAQETNSASGSTGTKVPKQQLPMSEKDNRTCARIRMSPHGNPASDSEEDEEEDEWRVNQSKGGGADGTTSTAAENSPLGTTVGTTQRVPKKQVTRKENDARVRARAIKAHVNDLSDSEDEDWQVCDHANAPKVLEQERDCALSRGISRVPKKQLTRKEQDGKLRARARAKNHGHDVSDSEDEEWKMSGGGNSAGPVSTPKMG